MTHDACCKGLSSSAALESCFAYAMNDLFNDGKIDKFELAKIGQSTEHNYCGVNCGIMDQFASAGIETFYRTAALDDFAAYSEYITRPLLGRCILFIKFANR